MALTSQGSAARKLDEKAGEAEPSMEEILASIRQIISEDEAPEDGLSERERYTHPTDPSNVNAPPPHSNSSAFGIKPEESTEERAARVRAELATRHEASSSKSGVEAIRETGVKLKTERLAEKFERNLQESQSSEIAQQAPVLSAAPPIPRFVPAVQSAATTPGAAPSAVVEQMAATMMKEKGAEIEVMLGDMVRPIVRKWLGDNLPTLVERLVREEIERASRGRQSS